MLRLGVSTCVVELQVHLSPDFAPPTYFVLRPAGEAGHDRQATPATPFRARRKGARNGAGTSGIADAERQSLMDELKLQFDPVALAAPVTDRVRYELARHEQNVLHVLPVETASAERTS
jgi:hypothetical protein